MPPFSRITINSCLRLMSFMSLHRLQGFRGLQCCHLCWARLVKTNLCWSDPSFSSLLPSSMGQMDLWWTVEPHPSGPKFRSNCSKDWCEGRVISAWLAMLPFPEAGFWKTSCLHSKSVLPERADHRLPIGIDFPICWPQPYLRMLRNLIRG